MQSSSKQRSIEAFLKSRQRLIVELMRLSQSIENNDIDQSQDTIESFCQQLIDYLSNGYFGSVGDVLSPTSRATPREYAIFDATTATAVTFNDRFANGAREARIRVKQGLATVALALETRFELEDELLSRTTLKRALRSDLPTTRLSREEPQPVS